MGLKQIELDFQQAIEQAKKLEESAATLEKLANGQYTDAIQTVAGNWRSEHASMYIKKAYGVQEDLVKTAKKMKDIAGDIRTAAQRLYNAEKAVQVIAEHRSY